MARIIDFDRHKQLEREREEAEVDAERERDLEQMVGSVMAELDWERLINAMLDAQKG